MLLPHGPDFARVLFLCVTEIMSRRRQRTFRGSPVCPSPCRRTWSAAGTGRVRPDGMVAWYYGRCFRRLLTTKIARDRHSAGVHKSGPMSRLLFSPRLAKCEMFSCSRRTHTGTVLDKNNVFFLSYLVCTPGAGNCVVEYRSRISQD